MTERNIEQIVSEWYHFTSSPADQMRIGDEIIHMVNHLEENYHTAKSVQRWLKMHYEKNYEKLTRKFNDLLFDYKYALSRLYFESGNGWNTNVGEGVEPNAKTIKELAEKWGISQDDLLELVSARKHINNAIEYKKLEREAFKAVAEEQQAQDDWEGDEWVDEVVESMKDEPPPLFHYVGRG